jgi:YHS domain-containing protein
MESILSVLLFIGFLYLMMRFGCGAHIHRAGCSHSSHGHGKSNEESLKTVTRDPVCGMEINAEQASGSIRYGSETYYFCSNECLRKFVETCTRTEKRHAA